MTSMYCLIRRKKKCLLALEPVTPGLGTAFPGEKKANRKSGVRV